MKREIKFRALKDDMSPYFVYGSLIYDARCVPRIQQDIKDHLFTTCLKGTEGQHSGLKDKNNVDIYEDDIIECGYGKGKVIFHQGCFMVEWIDDKEAYMELLCSRNLRTMRLRDGEDQFEVIGNIHKT